MGRIQKGLKEGLWPLQHELRVAANLSRMGYDLCFRDLEEDGGYDFLATQDGSAFEIEAKAVSVYTGWPIKPENVDKLLVEVKNDFIWNDEESIPVLALTLPSHLAPNRETLRSLVSAFCEAARTHQAVRVCDASVRFIGIVPSLDPFRLTAAALAHAKARKTMVMVNPIGNRLVLELESQKPIRLEKKIIRTINEAARLQFTGARPGVIWTHISFSDDEWFRQLSKSEEGKVCLFDGIANRVLLSKKRDHLTQIVFTGGESFISKDGPADRSSYSVAVYDSPTSRFEETFLFPDGRKMTT